MRRNGWTGFAAHVHLGTFPVEASRTLTMSVACMREEIDHTQDWMLPE
jgi:hypothetical protein